ncbi:MAG TPA: M4 family metallopeptidase, partial [Polyangia bacterium]
MLQARSVPTSLALAVAMLGGCGHPPPSAATDAVGAVEPSRARLQALTTRVLAEPPPAQIDELVVRRAHVDSAGDAHVVLDARHGGYRVFGAGIIRHERADGTSATTAAVDTRAIRFDETPPAIDASRAEALARDALADQHAEVRQISSELVYEREGDVYRLVHHVDVALDPRQTGRMEWNLSIDARDGRVLQRRDGTQRTQGTGHGYWYGTEPIQTFYYATPAPGYFTLEDKLRPSLGNRIYVTSYYDAAADKAATPVLFTNAGDDWGNGMLLPSLDTTDPAKGPMGVTGQTSAVDAMVAAANTWDMFVNIFNSPGPFSDGKGFRIVVNADPTQMPEIPMYTFLDNTVWINIDNQTCPHEGGFGTIGHELGHAWFDSFEYSPFTNEGAAMNEATGDIIGKLSEIYGLTARGLTTQGPPNPSLNVTPVAVTTLPSSWSDWTHRECPNNVRYMNHPSLGSGTNQGLDAWSSDIEATNMEVHKASGPISRMFYFLSQGILSSTATGPGEHSDYLARGLTGVGIPAAADVFYRGVAGWLPSEGAKFVDLRAAMEGAAGTDTTTKKAVQDAFAAVNVGPPADRTGPTISGVTPFSAPNHPVRATVSDPSGVKSVRYMARSGLATVGWGTATAAPWSVLVPANTPSGNYTVAVCAVDQLDNQTCVTASVTIDATAPVISTFVVTNPWVAGNKTVHLVATDANLSSATISLDGTVVWQIHSGGIYPIAPTLDTTPTISVPAGTAEGTHTLTAVVYDHFLNAKRSTTFLWDTTPPNVCDFNADPRTVFGQSASMNGEAGDRMSGISYVSFTLDGADVGDYPLNIPPATTELIGARWDNEPVGPHTLTITCKDKFGWT